MYPSVVSRYYDSYTWKSKLDFKRLSGPARILKHSNKILISCLHPDHPIRSRVNEVEYLTFKVSEKVDHSKNKVTGKRKKGGQVSFKAKAYKLVTASIKLSCQFLQETTPILGIKLKGEEDLVLIQVGIRGRLIEINQSIIENPKLLFENSEGRGYIAILLPKLENPFTEEHTIDSAREEGTYRIMQHNLC